MKTLRYTLIFVAVAGLTNGLIAITETKKATKKHTITKKYTAQKRAAPKQATSKKYTPAKTHHKTTKAVTAHTAVRKAAVPAQTKAAVTPTQSTTAAQPAESTTSKISNWLGLGAASAAATTAAAGHIVHHRGPQDWHQKHHFPAGWKEGFTGKWVGDKWVFAGHDLDWWHENEPVYYRDVVRPEATKAGVPRQHFVHGLTKKK